MTNKMKIKRLKQQNNYLIEQNMKLRQKIPMIVYARKIDENLEKFDRINDDLMRLYRKLHLCALRNKRTTLRYRWRIFMIKVRQFLEI